MKLCSQFSCGYVKSKGFKTKFLIGVVISIKSPTLAELTRTQFVIHFNQSVLVISVNIDQIY